MNLEKLKNVLSRHVNDPIIDDPRLHKKIVNTVDLEAILNFVPTEVEQIFRRKYGLCMLSEEQNIITDCAAGHALIPENAGKTDPKDITYEYVRDKEIKKKANAIK